MAQSQKSKNKNTFFYDEIYFDSVACDCEMGIVPQSKGLKKYTFHLYPNRKHLSYSYKDGKELINDSYARAILPDLLAIRDGNVEDIKTFIERHGFLLPLTPNADNSVESELLFVLINKLKATVSLISAIAVSDEMIDYAKIMALTMYLLLTPQVSIKLPNGKHPYSTCPHIISQVWNGTYTENESNQQNTNEGFVYNEITNSDMGGYVKDSIRPPHILLSLSDVYYAMECYEMNPTSINNKILFFYQDTTIFGPFCRLAINFLYNFYNDVGEIKAWNHKGELIITKNRHIAQKDNYIDIKPKESELAGIENGFKESNFIERTNNYKTDELDNMESDPMTSVIFNRRFDRQLQDGLLNLAKQTLKREMEHNLKGVTPSYDTETLSPAWSISDLLSGIYFSLFNIHAKEEQYRVCAKPKCGRHFLAKNDSIKQKFCSSNCSNAVAQSTHRNKIKEQPTET